VPVLKLKVGAGGYVEGSAVIGEDSDILNTTTQSNDCSSDFDAASENQSMSTMHSRLSSSSELDEQTPSEVIQQTVSLVVFRSLLLHAWHYLAALLLMIHLSLISTPFTSLHIISEIVFTDTVQHRYCKVLGSKPYDNAM